MRILIFNWRDLAHPNSGGAEVYTDRVATEWVKLGHEVVLFCAAVTDRPSREVADGGYSVIRRGSKHTVYREAKKYWLNEGAGRFDLVIDEVNTRPFGTPKFVRETPVVALIHQVCKEIWGCEYRWPVSWIGRYWFEPRWLKAYRDVKTKTVSNSSKESLEEFGLRDVEVILEGTDIVASRDSPEKEVVPTVIYVGRLSRNKRPDHVVEAFVEAKKSIANLQLWIVGSGPMEEFLKKKAPDDVRFFGRVSEAEKFQLISRAHFILVSSVREGWGLVVTEAAAVGTKAIGYSVAGLVDSICAANGVLVEPNVSAMATGIVHGFDEGYNCLPNLNGVTDWRNVAMSIIAELRDPTDNSEGEFAIYDN